MVAGSGSTSYQQQSMFDFQPTDHLVFQQATFLHQLVRQSMHVPEKDVKPLCTFLHWCWHHRSEIKLCQKHTTVSIIEPAFRLITAKLVHLVFDAEPTESNCSEIQRKWSETQIYGTTVHFYSVMVHPRCLQAHGRLIFCRVKFEVSFVNRTFEFEFLTKVRSVFNKCQFLMQLPPRNQIWQVTKNTKHCRFLISLQSFTQSSRLLEWIINLLNYWRN